jgi:DNA mismatch endonuclease, patch repair protein
MCDPDGEVGVKESSATLLRSPLSVNENLAVDLCIPAHCGGVTVTRTGPIAVNAHVTAQMSRMPRKNTGPELALRRELHARGMRFRLHADLPGRPDVVLTRARIAVFVDGCFWHGCPEHGTLPKNNRDWWRDKLEANVARDRRKDDALEVAGWRVVHVWEHEPVDVAADVIESLWREVTGRRRVDRSSGGQM